MTFTFQNKPLAGDILATSQSDLQNNFQYLQAALGKDHKVNFGDTNMTSFEGRHNQVSLSNIGSATPAFPSDGLDSLVYSFNGNLFWRNSTVTGTQLTYAAAGNPSIGAASPSNGFSTLPGGAMIEWGTGTGTNAAISVFTFPTVFPNNCFSVVITPLISNTTVFVQLIPGSISKTGFSYRVGSINTGPNNPLITFVAIGN